MSIDRRKKSRQPLERRVRFEFVEDGQRRTGEGTTLNLSQEGVAFRTQSRLPVGADLDLEVSWPVETGGALLRLVASGRVVRSERGIVGCTIASFAFRTDGVEPTPSIATAACAAG